MIIVDTREKKNSHITKYLCKNEAKYKSQKLDFGDYANTENPYLVVEKKRDLQECCGNLCQNKARFYREFDRAQAAGIKIVLLIEHGGNIKTLSDVAKWQNPRLKTNPKALTGRVLMERLFRLKMTYQCDIEFCEKRETGKRIVEILSGERFKTDQVNDLIKTEKSR